MRRRYKTKEWKYKKHQQYVMRKTLKKHRKKMRVPTRHKRKVPNQRIGKEQKKNKFVLKQVALGKCPVRKKCLVTLSPTTVFRKND